MDTTAKKSTASSFVYDPTLPHRVAIVLQDVDAVFANEAKNAVFRYNRTNYYNVQYELELLPIHDKQQLLLISPFTQAASALQYLKEAKRAAPSSIFPWLSAGRYRFTLIDAANLERVRTAKKIEDYEQFLLKEYPQLFQ